MVQCLTDNLARKMKQGEIRQFAHCDPVASREQAVPPQIASGALHNHASHNTYTMRCREIALRTEGMPTKRT